MLSGLEGDDAVAHFLRPTDEKGSPGYQMRSDGVLTAIKIDGVKAQKRIVLWGGDRNGNHLTFNGGAYDAKGRLLARIVAGPVLEKHSKDPDDDHLWYFRYRLEGVAEGVGTLTAVDGANMPFARIQVTVGRGDIKVTLDDDIAAFTMASTSTVTQSSFVKFRDGTAGPGDKLDKDTAFATVAQLRFKVEKNKTTFWVGACIPDGTTDFSKAYIFFHPDTMGPDDNPTYSTFTGRWPGVFRYVEIIGVQLAQVQKTVLLVPFMTNLSQSIKSDTNMFADRSLDTVSEILAACGHAAGKAATGPVKSLGLASFSSGINHLARFVSAVGNKSVIKEQIDLDSAFQINKHSNAPILKSARNTMVTQQPRMNNSVKWIQLDENAWFETSFGPPKIKGKHGVLVKNGGALHNNIGNFTFREAVRDKNLS